MGQYFIRVEIMHPKDSKLYWELNDYLLKFKDLMNENHISNIHEGIGNGVFLPFYQEVTDELLEKVAQFNSMKKIDAIINFKGNDEDEGVFNELRIFKKDGSYSENSVTVSDFDNFYDEEDLYGYEDDEVDEDEEGDEDKEDNNTILYKIREFANKNKYKISDVEIISLLKSFFN